MQWEVQGQVGFSLWKKSAQIIYIFCQGEEVEGDSRGCSAVGKENGQPSFLVGSH